jgi:uncharacterized protein
LGHSGAFYTAGMILEGIVTTRDSTGAVHVAPMGPIVDGSLTKLCLRPFKTSQTYQNLKRTPCGVFHVVDDVLLLARSAVGLLTEAPPTFPAGKISAVVLVDCCRWYEFEVREFDDANERAELLAQIVHSGRVRDFFGFNRAKHAVLEAAILATRVHLIPRAEMLADFERLKPAVAKTGGPAEVEAFALLERYVSDQPDSRQDN